MMYTDTPWLASSYRRRGFYPSSLLQPGHSVLAFNAGTGGLIFNPTRVTINCAYAGDGGTGGKWDGCEGGSKAARPEVDLKTALRDGLDRCRKVRKAQPNGYCPHNEIAVNLESVEAQARAPVYGATGLLAVRSCPCIFSD